MLVDSVVVDMVCRLEATGTSFEVGVGVTRQELNNTLKEEVDSAGDESDMEGCSN